LQRVAVVVLGVVVLGIWIIGMISIMSQP